MNRVLRSESAATAAEFALVLPTALIFFFGIIDTGRYMWDVNQIEKAVQVGARVAVTTDAVVGGLDDADFSGACGGLNVGDTIDCTDAMPAITCTASACAPASGSGGCAPVDCDTHRSEAFNTILQRVQRIAPFVGAGNLSVTYAAAGVGYYGDPSCFGERDKDGCNTGELPDIAPLTTVTITGPDFRPSLAPFANFNLPTRSYSLTLEDGRGTRSY